jgi:hypothetical protein
MAHLLESVAIIKRYYHNRLALLFIICTADKGFPHTIFKEDKKEKKNMLFKIYSKTTCLHLMHFLPLDFAS